MTKWPGYPSKYHHLDTKDADRFADEYRRTKPFSIKVRTDSYLATWVVEILGSIVIGLILGAILLYSCVGCASPYRAQAQLATEQYQRGEMSAAEYQNCITQLECLAQQRRVNISNAFNNFGTAMQRQQMINQMRAPQTIYLYNR